MNSEKPKYILAFLDWLSLCLAFAAAMQFHAGGTVSLFHLTPPFLPTEMYFFLGYAAFGLIIFQYNNLYNINIFMTFADQLLRVFESVLYFVVGFAVLSFFGKSSFIVNSRFILLLFIPLSVAFLMVQRFVIFASIFKFLAWINVYQQRTLIVGAGRLGKMLAANIVFNNRFGIRIVGYVDERINVGTPVFRGLRVLGGMEKLESIVAEQGVSQVLICEEGMESPKFLEVLERCMGTPAQVKIASPLYDIIQTFRFTERFGEIPVVGIGQAEGNATRHLAKRVFDVVFSLVGMLLLSPVYAAIAVAIRLDSDGPVFYRQTRIGKNGRSFDFYKFRSMLVGADQDESRKEKVAKLIRGEYNSDSTDTKIVDESKITRVGRFIRRTSLDELPQLFNVLIGDMSLVGPRPCLPYEWEHYEDWQKKRLNCMPGCTGVWQVSGRNSIGFNDMVILDFYYIQNASLFLDLQLILKTIPVMIFGRGGK